MDGGREGGGREEEGETFRSCEHVVRVCACLCCMCVTILYYLIVSIFFKGNNVFKLSMQNESLGDNYSTIPYEYSTVILLPVTLTIYRRDAIELLFIRIT